MGEKRGIFCEMMKAYFLKLFTFVQIKKMKVYENRR